MRHLDVDPIPVVIIKSPEELTELAVEFGAWSTWSVPQVGTVPEPIQILQRRPTRDEARIFLVAAGGATSVALAHRKDYLANVNNVQGGVFPAALFPRDFPYHSQQPVYAVAIGGGPATIITLDMAQAASQSIAEESVETIDEEYQLEGQGGPGYAYEPGPGYRREIND